MAVYTKPGAEVFAPQDNAGNPRSVSNGEAQVWATEVERGIAAAAVVVFIDGGWQTATAYDRNQALTHNDVAYRCIADHTSGATTEPGVGASWETVWEVMIGSIALEDGSVPLAKLASVGTDKLLGRDASGSGAPTEIGVGGGLEFDGSNGIRVADGGVGNAKLDSMAQGTVKMRRPGVGAGAPTDTTLENLKTDLFPDFAGDVWDAVANGVENLFDIGEILHRKLPSASTGVIETNIEFWSTGPIPVVAGEMYSFTPPETFKRYAFYDVSDAFISASNFSGTFTAPENAAYVIGSNRYTDITPDEYVIVEGAVSYSSDPKALAPAAANGQEVVTPKRFSHLRSRNLFDANSMTMGVSLNISGETEANVNFFTTDFMPVMPGRTYSFTPPAIVKRYCFYDDAKIFVSVVTSSGSFTVPAGARYVRGCARWDDTPHETFMIVEGDLPAEYQPFAGAQFEVQSNKNQPNGYPGLDEDGLLPPGVFPALAASPLTGKTIAAIGDSITYGFIPRNAPGYPGQLNSYLILMGETLLAASTLNYGISGSTLGDNGAEPTENSPMSQRFAAMSDDADLVILMGGTNDVRKGVPLGVMGDTTDLTYYGALDVLSQGLLNKYRYVEGGETRKVVFATPIRLLDDAEPDGLDANLSDYCQAVKDVATKYAIPVFDAYNLSGLTPELFRTLEGTEPGYTDNYNPYVTDGVHPTQEGHRILADAFAGFIRGLY